MVSTMNNKRKKKLLAISGGTICILYVIIFLFLSVFMNNRSSQAINEVGYKYMSGMSQQLSQQFTTAVELHIEQINSVVNTLFKEYDNKESIRKDLIGWSTSRGYESLSYLTSDNQIEMLYGNRYTLDYPEGFFKSLNSGETKLATVTDSDGELLFVFGVPMSHNIDSQKGSTAIIASLPITYLNDILLIDNNNNNKTKTYSFIIHPDGEYVIKFNDEGRDNYFDRVEAIYGESGNQTPDEFIKEISHAIENGSDYSHTVLINGNEGHIYQTKLPYTEWYMLSFLSRGNVNETVKALTADWMKISVACCLIIVGAFAVIFVYYYRYNKAQISELEEMQRRAENAHREAEKAKEAAESASRAKSEFLANMSHDIRTPMNAIVGMTSIAAANMDDPEKLSDCLQKITQSGKHLLGLINNVLDMSKIESGKMTLNIEQMSIRESVESIITIIQPQVKAKKHKFNIYINNIYAENVYCDELRLNQLLINLLSNAVKYTQDGGIIHFSICQEPSPKGDKYVRTNILVKDNGSGMTKEFQEKIFDQFTREDNGRINKIEGTGLGMAIAKHIVDSMEGSINVSSELGKGSEFRIVFDLEKAVDGQKYTDLPKWHVLVVDDDEQLCDSAVDALESIGMRADKATDGESAVSMAGQCGDDKYDAVIIDWKMPVMNGIETAKRIRDISGENTPILIISAYDWSEVEDNAKESGIDGFISKPLFCSTLYDCLRKFTNKDDNNSEEKKERKISLHGKKILMAEDNDINWEVASAVLGSMEAELEWAQNGQICLDKFRQSPEGYYDIVLMDLRMPVMNGYEAAKAIRSLERADAKQIPIIAMTADAFSDDIKRCIEAGMDEHIAKPIDVKEMENKLLKCMRKRKHN